MWKVEKKIEGLLGNAITDIDQYYNETISAIKTSISQLYTYLQNNDTSSLDTSLIQFSSPVTSLSRQAQREFCLLPSGNPASILLKTYIFMATPLLVEAAERSETQSAQVALRLFTDIVEYFNPDETRNNGFYYSLKKQISEQAYERKDKKSGKYVLGERCATGYKFAFKPSKEHKLAEFEEALIEYSLEDSMK